MKRAYEEFCRQVIAACPRATGRERDEICRELTDHLEDRVLDMQSRGYGTEEAARRSVAAMGDPTEIGRAWNARLSPLWLWLGRAAKVAVVLLALVMILPGLARGRGLALNLEARFSDLDGHRYGMDDAAAVWALDEDVRIGEDHIRFFQACLEPAGGGVYSLRVRMVVYAHNPLRDNNLYVLQGGLQGPEQEWDAAGASHLGEAVSYMDYDYLLHGALPDQRPDSVPLSIHNAHGSFSVEIPVEWEDVP